MNLPKITALCLTVGRWKCIGEAIHSFNLQTYPAELRKLIVIDTHPTGLVFDEPLPSNVEYVKVPSHQFKSLSDKTRFALSLVKTQLMCQWEDDDVWLPFHLERLAKRFMDANMHRTTTRVGHRMHFASTGGVEESESHHPPVPLKIELYGNLCWCRYIFDVAYNACANKNPFDSHFMALPWKDSFLDFPDEVPGYIYRWANGQHHFSGWYSKDVNHEELFRRAEDIHCAVDISDKPVKLEWRHDYRAICGKVLTDSGHQLPEYW